MLIGGLSEKIRGHVMDFDLFLPTNLPIGGFQCMYDDAEWVVYANPLDMTASFRPGCGHAPNEIRGYAANLETINPFNDRDIAEVMIHDLGDLKGPNFLEQARKVSAQLEEDGKKVMILGGEHTITIVTAELYSNYLYVIFDAHLDLRDEYNGNSMSHACAIRRVIDHVPPSNIVFIGTRAVSMEEREYIKSNPEIKIFSGHSWSQQKHQEAIEYITTKLDTLDGLYLSVDMDGFDPSFVPGVGNPEPLGLTTREFFAFVNDLPRIDAADINELNPKFDPTGASSAIAARLVLTILTH